MDYIIELKGISKEFKTLNRKGGRFAFIKNLFSTDYKVKKAVNQIDLNILRGEIVGFIGPNGAGKSTTIKMLTGVLVPTEGMILVNGCIPYKHRVKYVKEIGVVFGQRSQLWWDLSVIDSFQIMKEMYELEDEEYEKNMKIFEEELNISELFHKSVRHLSLGQKMLCEIVAVLLYTPKVIFLDEPTIGLDIAVKTKIRNIIKRMNLEHNVTIILTTHDISDIEALCNRIIIMDQGMIIFNGSIDKMKQLTHADGKIIEITTRDIISHKTLYDIQQQYQKTCTRIKRISDKKLELICDNSDINMNELLMPIMERIKVENFTILQIKIEDIIKQVYDGKLL